VATWRRWEHGSGLPLATRIPSIASALAVPVDALFVEQGWAALDSIRLTPEALERINKGGQPVIDELERMLSSHFRTALANATPFVDDIPLGFDVRRRRTRAEVLADQSVRLTKLRASRPPVRQHLQSCGSMAEPRALLAFDSPM